jgi:HEAT repeat protein
VAAISALASIRTPESIKYLIMALADENPEIRAGAAMDLGATGDPEAFEPICLLLADTEDSVRAAAARALGKLGHKDAVPYLIRLLSDPNGFVVTTAINALRKIGGHSSMDALVGMLGSADTEIKRTAIKALAGFEEARQHIIAFLKDPDWATRMAAVEALGKLSAREELERHLDTEEDPVVRETIERLIANVP